MRIIILDKKKITLYSLMALCFMALGVWVSLDNPANTANIKILIKYFIGICSVLLFGSFEIYCLKKLTDKCQGLVFDDDGFTDNASVISTVFIPWQDIARIEEHEMQNSKSISIYLKHPENLLKEGKALQRFLNYLKHKFYGTPVNIAAGFLQIDHEELKLTFEKYFANYTMMPNESLEMVNENDN